MGKGLQFLRPYYWIDLGASSRAVYAAPLRFYSISRPYHLSESKTPCVSSRDLELYERIRELRLPTSQLYPRVSLDHEESTCRAFLKENNDLVAEQSKNEKEVVIRGRSP